MNTDLEKKAQDPKVRWRKATAELQMLRSCALVWPDVIEHEFDGLKLPPLRVRHLAAMEALGISHVVDAEPDAYELPRIWLIWTDNIGPGIGPWRRWYALKHVRKRPLAAMTLVSEALKEEFRDAPVGGSKRDRKTPITSLAGTIIDMLASEYGWTLEQIMDLPVRAAWVLIRAIIKRKDPDTLLGNPTDRIIVEWLTEINTKDAKHAH